MKVWYYLFLVFCVGCFSAVGASLSEDEIEHLEDTVKIGGVDDDTEEDEATEQDLEVLSFYTYQYEDAAEKYRFYIKVVAEVTDGDTDETYLAKMAKMQGDVDVEYTGEDNWKFKIPYADMDDIEISAYVIRYGVVDEDNEFIPVAVEMDDVDSLEELEERTTELIPQKPVLFHQYNYRDT